MRNVLSYILVMVLIGSMVPLTVMPAIATGIPGDDDGNDNLTEKELAGNILNYMLGWDVSAWMSYGMPRTSMHTGMVCRGR